MRFMGPKIMYRHHGCQGVFSGYFSRLPNLQKELPGQAFLPAFLTGINIGGNFDHIASGFRPAQ